MDGLLVVSEHLLVSLARNSVTVNVMVRCTYTNKINMGICLILINRGGKFVFLGIEKSQPLKLQNAYALTGPSERVTQEVSQHLFSEEFLSKVVSSMHAGLPGRAEGMDTLSRHRKDLCQPSIVKANSVLLRTVCWGHSSFPKVTHNILHSVQIR